MTSAHSDLNVQHEKSRIPQLRVILNTECNRRCLYCRPSGEAALSISKDNHISIDELLKCISVLVDSGIREIRLTGGDPALYPKDKLISLVREIARLGIQKLSLVTRNGCIRHILPMLKEAGLTHITFSLDSMNAERWLKVCGKQSTSINEHQELLDAIKEARQLEMKVNLNCVLLKDTSDKDFLELVAFAEGLSIDLKIEEIIRDIGQNNEDNDEHHVNLNSFKNLLKDKVKFSEIIQAPGGLGHPMEVLHIDNSVSVTWKMFAGGACYSPSCHKCTYFPCDDALMALRLLPDGKLQICLKRDDNLLDLVGAIRKDNAANVVDIALAEYKNSKRYSFEEINSMRKN